MDPNKDILEARILEAPLRANLDARAINTARQTTYTELTQNNPNLLTIAGMNRVMLDASSSFESQALPLGLNHNQIQFATDCISSASAILEDVADNSMSRHRLGYHNRELTRLIDNPRLIELNIGTNGHQSQDHPVGDFVLDRALTPSTPTELAGLLLASINQFKLLSTTFAEGSSGRNSLKLCSILAEISSLVLTKDVALGNAQAFLKNKLEPYIVVTPPRPTPIVTQPTNAPESRPDKPTPVAKSERQPKSLFKPERGLITDAKALGKYNRRSLIQALVAGVHSETVIRINYRETSNSEDQIVEITPTAAIQLANNLGNDRTLNSDQVARIKKLAAAAASDRDYIYRIIRGRPVTPPEDHKLLDQTISPACLALVEIAALDSLQTALKGQKGQYTLPTWITTSYHLLRTFQNRPERSINVRQLESDVTKLSKQMAKETALYDQTEIVNYINRRSHYLNTRYGFQAN